MREKRRERRKERGGERGERDDPGPTSPKWLRPWGVIIVACTCHVSAFGFVAPIWFGSFRGSGKLKPILVQGRAPGFKP